MNKFLQSFKDKKLRYGTFSTLTAILVIAVLVAINLVVGQMNVSYDLTTEKRYSLTQETKDALKDLNQDITVYALFRTGTSDAYMDQFRELLDQYPSVNNHIKVEYKDPYLYPQFVEKYVTEDQQVGLGSIIVEGPSRFKVIPIDKLVTQEMDYQTFQNYVKSIDLEPQVTNTIRYVLDGNSSNIYVVGGHNEQALPESLKSRISLANYEVKDVTLLNQTSLPEDCNLLFITTPERDWTKEEAELVKTYLQNDGRAVFFLDFTGTDFPNLDGVLSTYGAEIVRGVVFEGDANHYFQGSPINLIPQYVDHEITHSLAEKGYMSIAPMSMAVKEAELKRSTTKFEPILVTSDKSYAKTNTQSQSIDKEQGDIDGPFALAAAISDSVYTDASHTTKIFFAATTSLLNESINNYVMGANYDLVINSINWTQDKSDSVYISPKTSTNTTLTMNGAQAVLVIGISLLVPIVIITFGVVRWLRRRNS